MDSVAAMLDGHRARRPFLLRCVLGPPWAIRIEDRAQLALIAMTAGEAWLVHDDGRSVHLSNGDVALVRGPRPYLLADQPDRPPGVVIEPGQVCRTADGQTQTFSSEVGLRTWGNDEHGATVMLTAVYELDTQIGGHVVELLPEVAHLPGLADAPVTTLLAAELGSDVVGQDVIVDRLADLLLVTALRDWFAPPDRTAPPGWRGHDDAVVGPALRLMHEQPAEPWTIARLAAAVNVSRATLARRFTDLVGLSPITYLTQWRLDRAADLLYAPGATVGAVARSVGYGTPFAFSTAFKRAYGISPAQHRAAHRERQSA